jgi:hypothetical protein
MHFIKVFVTESFINKKWEQDQIAKLVARQERRIGQLEKKIEIENKATLD